MADEPAATMIPRMFKEIFEEGHVGKIDEYFEPDFVDHGPGGMELHGVDEFRAAAQQQLAAFSDIHFEVSNIIEQGDLAAWLVRFTAKHTGDGLGFPATGRTIDILSANLGRRRNGRAIEHWSEQGMLQMLQQLGVIPGLPQPQPTA